MSQIVIDYNIAEESAFKPSISFDLDDTLIWRFLRLNQSPFILRVYTWKRIKALGYTQIAVFSNQLKSDAEKLNELTKTIIRNLEHIGMAANISIRFHFAIKNDANRKPYSGMFMPYANSLMNTFVGDAAGRPKDFEDTDAHFAHVCGMKFLTDTMFCHGVDLNGPPKVFTSTKINLIPVNELDFSKIQPKSMIMMMGAQNSGKSHLARHFASVIVEMGMKPEIISRDIHGNSVKAGELLARQSTADVLIIDNTNLSRSQRALFLNIPMKIYIVAMTTDKETCIALNVIGKKALPLAAIHTAFVAINREPLIAEEGEFEYCEYRLEIATSE